MCDFRLENKTRRLKQNLHSLYCLSLISEGFSLTPSPADTHRPCITVSVIQKYKSVYSWLLLRPRRGSECLCWSVNGCSPSNFGLKSQNSCERQLRETEWQKYQTAHLYFLLPLKGDDPRPLVQWPEVICTPTLTRPLPGPLAAAFLLLGFRSTRVAIYTAQTQTHTPTHTLTHWYTDTLEVEVLRGFPGKLLPAEVSVTGRVLVDWSLQVQVSENQTRVRNTLRWFKPLKLNNIDSNDLTMTPGLRSKFLLTMCSSSVSVFWEEPKVKREMDRGWATPMAYATCRHTQRESLTRAWRNLQGRCSGRLQIQGLNVIC